ncbi:hypothetical protein BH09BAC5_BH09BAC5_19390 [soil metagenome]
MKKLYTLAAFLFFGIAAQAQVAFWTEGFGSGCTQGNLATAYTTGPNGAWTTTSTGTNDPYANLWFVSATEAGTGVGNCGDGCLSNSLLDNRTLHVGSAAIQLINQPADPGAAYNSGGVCASFGICVLTALRCESPTINCSGKSNISLAFNYFENGDGTNDDATLWYFDGTTWTLLQNVAKTPLGNCSGQGKWTAYSIMLPSSANNNPNVKIGFNWVNNDDGVGTDPSFAVDDIALTTGPNGIDPVNVSGMNVFSSGNGQLTIDAKGFNYKAVGVYNMLGEELNFTSTNNIIQLNNEAEGIYIVALEVNGIRIIRKVMVN